MKITDPTIHRRLSAWARDEIALLAPSHPSRLTHAIFALWHDGEAERLTRAADSRQLDRPAALPPGCLLHLRE